MKEIIKKIATKVRNGMKEFFAMLAQDLISKKVDEALSRERERTCWLNAKANARLLETIVRKCPYDHFVVLATADDLYQGLQETRNVMRANPERAFISGTALKYPVHSERPITSDDYQTAYALNPYSYEYRNDPDKMKKNVVNCFKSEIITYFEYAKFN